MKHSSGSLSADSQVTGDMRQAARKRWWLTRRCLIAYCLLLIAALTGCESLQRKFTRKPAHAPERPNPIINFQDYARTMTPLDRYYKHYMMFDYWNDELLMALQANPLNAKRYRRDSTEALAELEAMKSLLMDQEASQLIPLIEQRAKIDRLLQNNRFNSSDANTIWRELERQTRQIYRYFFWRNVETHLRDSSTSGP